MKKWYIYIMIIILIVVFTIIEHLNKIELGQDGMYTICTITDIEKGLKRAFIIKYRFIYKSSLYLSIDQIYKNRKELVGRRYIVRFLPTNPRISEILYDKRIWCDTVKAPKIGWKEIPNYFPFYPESKDFNIENLPCEMYQKNYYEKLKEELETQ